MKIYKKRIVNINLNILIASAIATIIAAYPVELISKIGNSMAFTLFSAFAIDSIFDGIVFSTLHWMSNNHKGRNYFLKDIGQIQTQRIILSGFFFVFAVGTDALLMMYFGATRLESFLKSYLVALIITRAMHTVYGLKTGLFEERYK